MRRYDAAMTSDLLDDRALIRALEDVLLEYAGGAIESPARMAVRCGGGRGILLSMPCHAADVIVHKLLTFYPGNPAAGRPALQGDVTCFDAQDGTPLFCLDGPTVTARRTAAVTMLGIQRLRPAPATAMLLIGTGVQAMAHARAAAALFPALSIHVRGRLPRAATAFCARADMPPDRLRPATPDSLGACDVVVAATSSTVPVFDAPASTARLVVGVGAFRPDMVEIGADVIRGSQVYVDDPVGAPGEAGDLLAAGVDWAAVKPLADAVRTPPDFSRPIMLKSVGCAAWDLAACRAARQRLGAARELPANG